jgi:MHS family citrate/tricarballylate:H+ symporter-like MFS transporter
VAISRTVRFFLFGFYASYISKAFFPTSSEFASLMLTFAVFGAGFLMRPLGAIVLGSYVDRIGRRQGLIVTLGIMACGTVLIAFVPDYSQIGLAAPLLVLLGRLLQGFSAGVELGGVSVYLAEIATPGHKGFTPAGSRPASSGHRGGGRHRLWHPAVAEPGADCRLGLARAVFHRLPDHSADFPAARSLQETDAFLARKHRPSLREIFATIGLHWRTIVAGMFLVSLTTTLFYFITVYTPTFGKSVLHLSAEDSLIVTLCVGLSNFCWLPIGGALSDRIGRKPLLLGISLLALLTAYPPWPGWQLAPALSGC